MSAGFDHVETGELKKRGIRLGTSEFRISRICSSSIADSTLSNFTAPDALTDATADIGAMLALMASRRAGEVRGSTDFKH